MSEAETNARVVLTTAPTPEVAGIIARALVEERLAACANIIPGVRSIYRWEGDIQDDWDAVLDDLEEVEWADKTLALFGLGDQFNKIFGQDPSIFLNENTRGRHRGFDH